MTRRPRWKATRSHRSVEKTESHDLVAIEVFLGEDATQAFSRITSFSSRMAEDLAELAKSARELSSIAVAVPQSPLPTDYAVLQALEDLRVVAKAAGTHPVLVEKIDELRTKLADLVGKAENLSTSDLASGGGLLSPAQGSFRRAPPPVTDTSQEESVTVTVIKAESEDEDQKTVLGVVLEPEVVDSQNEIYSAEEIEKSAWNFMENYQVFGEQHQDIGVDIAVLESYIAPVDLKISGEDIKKGTWLMRVRVLDDDIWKRIKSGDLTGFSVGGWAASRSES